MSVVSSDSLANLQAELALLGFSYVSYSSQPSGIGTVASVAFDVYIVPAQDTGARYSDAEAATADLNAFVANGGLLILLPGYPPDTALMRGAIGDNLFMFSAYELVGLQVGVGGCCRR